MAETFVCDRCGDQYPIDRMKEVFREDGKQRVKEQLCPSCLDKRMNEAGSVRGVAGDEKAAAVHITEAGESPERTKRQSLGERST